METTGIVPTPGENYGQKEGTYHFRSVSFFCVVHEMSSPNTNTEFISFNGYSTICNHTIASFPLVLFLFSSTTDWQFYPLKKKLLLCTKGWASFTRNSWTSTRTTKKTNSDFKLRARFLLSISIFFFPALLTHFTASSKSIVLQLLSYYSIPVHVAYSEVYNILLSSSACWICHSTKNLSISLKK